jgi:acyl-CoA thioester hydrolase
MACEIKIKRRVEFSETDMAGLMHFSNFFRFMEAAEHAFLRSLGFSVVLDGIAPGLGLPRVHADCDYLAPLKFEDEVEVHLRVSRKTPRSLTYQFQFRRLGPAPALEVARGTLTVVCAARQPDGTLKAALLPKAVADQISAAPRRSRPRRLAQ